MNTEFQLGEIEGCIWCVNRGIKPCANIIINVNDLNKVIKYINKSESTLKILVKSINYPEYNYNAIDIYIYKYDHIKTVIENIPSMDNPMYHWYLGKLFGISDVEIENFINRQ